jgi:hypothetical protein
MSHHSAKDVGSYSKEQMMEVIKGLQEKLRHNDGGGSGKDLKFPRPLPYDGENGDVQSFLTQVQAYLFMSEAGFKHNHERVLYAGGLLTGKAAEWWEPTLRDYLEQKEEQRSAATKAVFGSYAKWAAKLKETFGNPDETRTAERKLLWMKQTKSASTYAVDFQRMAARLSWGEQALIVQFYKGLREDVKDEMSKVERPDELGEYIALAIQIDNRLYERRLERGNGMRSGPTWGYRANQDKGRGGSTATGYHAGPMDLDVIQQDGKKPKGNCYNCGKPGHYARECRQKKREWRRVPEQRNHNIQTNEGGAQISMVSYGEDSDEDYDPVWFHDTQPYTPLQGTGSAPYENPYPRGQVNVLPTTEEVDSEEEVPETEHDDDADDESEEETIPDTQEHRLSENGELPHSVRRTQTLTDDLAVINIRILNTGLSTIRAQTLLTLLASAWEDSEADELAIPGDHPWLHMRAPEHHLLSWFSCVYHSCPEHIFEKVDHRWFPTRPDIAKEVPYPYLAGQTMEHFYLQRHDGDVGELHKGPSDRGPPLNQTINPVCILLTPGQPDGHPRTRRERAATPYPENRAIPRPPVLARSDDRPMLNSPSLSPEEGRPRPNERRRRHHRSNPSAQREHQSKNARRWFHRD